MKIGFISLGCSKNLVDSEYIMGLFDDRFEIVNDPKQAEVIVINTCGFIQSAKEESIATILEMADYRQNNLKYLIVTGCLVQRYQKELEAELEEADLLVKITDYEKLPEILSELLGYEIDLKYGQKRKIVGSRYFEYLKISDGCFNNCTFCAIPLIRGVHCSIPKEEIIKQAKFLEESGIKELNIVAQDTTAYGLDLYGKRVLKDLLVELNQMSFDWIRILYMYPDEIEDDLLLTMRSLDKVLPYFDIPIQSGSDKILKLMHRRGDSALIREKIARIKELFPKPVLRTTFIVGFPYEEEEDFLDSLKLAKESEFNSLGAFTYSMEEGTKAYDMPQVDEDIKNQRLERLMNMQREVVEKHNKQRLDMVYDVLIEEYDSLLDSYVGRAYFNAPEDVDGVIYVKADKLTLGEFYPVRITGYRDYDLIGEIAE